MGAGNFIPSEIYDLHYRMVYVPFNYEEDADEIDAQDRCDNLKEDILSLCKRFSKTGMDVSGDRERFGNDERVLYRNGALAVTIADNQWSAAVTVRQLEADDYEPRNTLALTARHVDIFAVKLFAKLHEYFPDLAIRCGPWMSGAFTGDISKC